MSQAKTVRAPPLKEQLRAAAIAGCEALSVTPSDYNRWLGASISTQDMLARVEADLTALLSQPQGGIRLEFLMIRVS